MTVLYPQHGQVEAARDRWKLTAGVWPEMRQAGMPLAGIRDWALMLSQSPHTSKGLGALATCGWHAVAGGACTNSVAGSGHSAGCLFTG